MPAVECLERIRLSQDVSDAGAAVYAAKRTLEVVRLKKDDETAAAAKLAACRLTERQSVTALDNHRKDHGC